MERLPENHIRLVSLSKPKGSEKVHVSRRTLRKLPAYDIQTRETFEYVALSYCWGKERELIHCDDDDVEIPTQLARALPLLQQQFSEQLIWIDSLCIDQHNLDEKSEQVSMMSKIYEQAQSVVVWLGLETEDIYHDLQRKDLLMTDHEQRIQLLQRISTVQWFYRAWTFQEIRLGRHAVVMLGTKRMEWEDFIKTILTVQELEPNFSSVTIRSKPSSFMRFMYTEQDRFFAVLGELNMGMTFDLAGLLFLTWHRECTEKRDKVYSVLGLLAKEQLRPGSIIPIDYQIEWSGLCIKAARLCINISSQYQEPLHPRLKILKVAGMIERWKSPMTGHWDLNEATQLLSHPSWAPDWWYPPQKTRSFRSLVFDKRGIFDRLTFCCSDQPPVQDLEDTSPFLILKGVLLGIVNVDEGPMTVGGRPHIHAPPRCAGYGHQVLSSLQSPNSTSTPLHIPKVDILMFSEAVQRHFDGDCSCFPFDQRRGGFSSPSSFGRPTGNPASTRFDSQWAFPILDFPKPADTPQEQFSAQVLSQSVESGDWLVLLEGGGMPFLLRPLKNVHNRTTKPYELSGFSHKTRPLPDDAGCFVLVGEASMCWDRLWPGQWDVYCRAGTFVIV